MGGSADCLVVVENDRELRLLLEFLAFSKTPWVLLGTTANLLFSDEGLRAVGIMLGKGFRHFSVEGDGHDVIAGSAIWVPAFSRKVANAGLAGAEHVCGIPGTLGGLICMNGGSQRKGIGDNLVSVRAVSPDGRELRYNRAECEFAYRSSRFQGSQEIVLEARFRYPRSGEPREIRREMLSILSERSRKFPRKLPNCGSVFISNPDMYDQYGPPGALVEQCGLKGVKRGGAMISESHANFINNIGGATASDILSLVHLMREEVAAKFGFSMDTEARFVREDGSMVSAHDEAALRFGQVTSV